MISVENLSKHFGSKTAVDGISFSVERGEVLGFLGPNGAGKSTTMRMVTGYIPPTSGTVMVGGHNMWTDSVPAKKLIGYLPENAPAYTDMTVKGFIGFAAEVRGLGGADKAKAVDRVVEMCFLENVLHQSVDTLSKGYLHRTCLAQSIVHDPDILILDEPTDGLDPNQKHEVRKLIAEMASDKIIVISTHILEEVQALCNRVMIISQGRLLADDTPAGLIARSRYHNAVTLAADDVRRIASVLSELPEVARAEVKEGELTVFPAGAGLFDAVSRSVAEHGWAVSELRYEAGRLDEVFRMITQGESA